MRGQRIEVAAEVYQALQEAFKRRLAQQNRELDQLRDLQEDFELSLSLNAAEPAPPLQLRALGYFLDNYRLTPLPALANDRGDSPELTELRGMAAQRYGPEFLAQSARPCGKSCRPSPQRPNGSTLRPGQLTFAQHYKTGC